ncbi:Protein priB [Fusarium austroafricanum]|uniref:Protein priB n=1 Tax=Fusarium austroafricanum TaxID=2364996 RepID=A0A8H4KL98_9HYPO|nr:Protein priB [Fusarium austroafricanum]
MILTISSRVFQPEAHRSIQEHAEFLLGRALLGCDSAIENIWAIICMYHWKDANDTRGYTLIGFALRMAASAEWNMTRRSISYDLEELRDANELQVRQRRDKDRVWLALGNIDRTSSYFTDRPLSTTIVLENVASRQWLSLTEWTYPLGDGKAIGGHELTGIARSVYDSMMKTRVDSVPSQPWLDFNTFQNDMSNFNTKITAWGDYWRSTFATFPNHEPFQTQLIYLFRDYMRLYFNSVFLHRMIVSENRPSLREHITHTTGICYSSALSVLRQAIEMGELDIIYYLWDTAHLMIAYSSMMIPKLLRQDIDQSIISKNEAVDALTKVTTTYVAAARSMGNAESHVCGSQTNAVSVQAHLLSAILARLKTDISQTEQSQANHHTPFSLRVSWIEDQLNRSTLFSDGRMEQRQADFIDMDSQTVGQPEEISSLMPQMYEGLGLMLDDEFMNSRYLDVGLLSWDEPGIFVQPH